MPDNDQIVVPSLTDIPPSDPLDDVTDQSVEQAAERFFAEHGPQTSPDETTQQPAEQTAPESPTEFDPNEQFFYAPGQALTRQEIAAFSAFQDLLEADPRLSQVILNHLRGGEPPQPGSPDGRPAAGQYPPVPQQPAYPYQYPTQPQYSAQPPPQQAYQQQYQPELDLSDPTIAYLHNTIQSQQAALQNYYQELHRQQAILGTRVEAENRQIIDTAVSNFKSQYELDDDTIHTIRAAAGRMEVIPTIMRTGVDPVTGQPTSPDPLNAVTRAMELASMAIPEVRELILSNQQIQSQQDATRKSKLRAVGGSSRTAPRTAPVPANPQDRRAAMKQIVEAAMNGTYQES